MTNAKTSFWTPARIGAVIGRQRILDHEHLGDSDPARRRGTWRFGIVYSGYAHRVTLDEVVAY